MRVVEKNRFHDNIDINNNEIFRYQTTATALVSNGFNGGRLDCMPGYISTNFKVYNCIKSRKTVFLNLGKLYSQI